MIKIAFIIPSLSLGGMERVMSVLLNEFSKKNIEIYLVLFGKIRKIEYDIPESIIVRKPTFEYSDSNRFIYTLKTIYFLRKEVKKIKPDSILSFGEYWNNLVLLSLYGLKYPIYISDRSQPNKNLGRVQNLLRAELYPKAAGYIAQTEKASKIASQKKWSDNIVIIGNPINQVSELKATAKENIILTVGRLIPTKHIDELIQIFNKTDPIDWKLVVIGGNAKNLNLLEDYRQLVIDLNLEDRVQLVGAISHVADYYKKARIFAFTSSSEGFPNVIGEAMSYGLPVIAYDCTAGPSDLIIDGETGFLIAERDQQVYIKYLKRLMDDSQLRHTQGSRALEKIKEFDAEIIAEKFFNFITT